MKCSLADGGAAKEAVRVLAKVSTPFSRLPAIPARPRRLLLLTCHWLGDTFWAMQVIPALQHKYPDAELHVGCKGFSMPLFHGLVPPTRVHAVNSVISDRHRENADRAAWRREQASLRAQHFDLAIDLTGNRYSCWFLRRLGIPTVGLDLHFLSPLYSRRGPAFDYSRHLRFRPWEAVRILFDCEAPALLFPVRSALAAGDVLAELGVGADEPLALLAPGAGWPEKQWAPANFTACGLFLAERGLRVLVAGAPKESELCLGVAAGVPGAVTLTADLQRTIAVLPRLRLALTNDAGLAHLAAAADAPLVALYLTTDPARCGPVGRHVTVLQGKDLSLGGVQTAISRLIA